MNKTFRKILIVEIIVALIVLIGFSANRQPTSTASPSPSGSVTPTEQPNYVESCTEVVKPNSSNDQWDSAPALSQNDKRNFWVLDTNCGQIVVQTFPDKAPVSVNNLRFLSDNDYYNNSVCHRLTKGSMFVLQCGDPLGTGLGNAGYTIMEENKPESGAGNYPKGTVALAKTNAPNSSGAQFFIVYADTTLGANYSIVGKIIKGMDIVEAIANAGIVGNVNDGRPNQNFGFLTTKFTKTNPEN